MSDICDTIPDHDFLYKGHTDLKNVIYGQHSIKILTEEKKKIFQEHTGLLTNCITKIINIILYIYNKYKNTGLLWIA